MLFAFFFAAALAFPNAGFENRAEFGRVNDHVEVMDGIGYSASAGMRIHPHTKKYTWKFETDFKPRFGRTYVFSVSYREHGKCFAHLAWESYGGGKHLAGNWNVTTRPLENGWIRKSVAVTPKFPDDQVEKNNFFTVVTSNGSSEEDWVDFDDVEFREDDPEWYLTNVWPTHNRVFSDNGRVRFYSGYLGPFVPEGAEAEFTVALKAGGSTLAARKAKDDNGSFTVDFGKLAYEGPARLVVTLADAKTGKICGTKELDVLVGPTYRPKKGEVSVTEQGDALVDGKPFMPLGFYTSLGKTRDLDKAARAIAEMHAAGFNTMVEYWIQGWREKLPAYYAVCESNDMRVLYNLTASCHHQDELETRYRAEAAAQLNYPPLLGWYVTDEAPLTLIPFVTKLRRMLNEVSPGYPTWECNLFEPAPYLGLSDIYGEDDYPIDEHNPDLQRMDAKMKEMARCKPAAMWLCGQCFNKANYRPHALESREKYLAAGREPKENEMLSVPLLQASYGAKGFIFYMWDDLFRGPVPERYEGRKRAIFNVGAALKSLEPFILANQPIAEIPHVDTKGKTRVVALSDGKGAYRVLVIGLAKENECAFRLPVAYGPLASRCGNTVFADGGHRFTGREFSCDILECSYARVKSSRDGAETRTGFYFPPAGAPVPLLVGLHSWSTDASYPIPGILFEDWCRKNGWAFLYPDFRGPNRRPEACGSELAVQDILDAVAWAKKTHSIDADRVYVAGGSGGGHMALLAAAKAPDVFAAVAAFCPITDLARWHADGLRLKNGYPAMLESSCGGVPEKCPREYARRSPLPLLGGVAGPKFYIAAGIHDGHGKNSVPVGHSVRAFNALAAAEDRLSEADIAHLEAAETAPARLAFTGNDPFYAPVKRIHLRVTSKDTRLTLFEGGHQDNYPAALDFLARQKRGAASDWTLPVRAAESAKGDISK